MNKLVKIFKTPPPDMTGLRARTADSLGEMRRNYHRVPDEKKHKADAIIKNQEKWLKFCDDCIAGEKPCDST